MSKSNKNGYWISLNLDGTIRHLYKVENDAEVYRYENGAWVEANQIYAELGWNDDYDNISDQEAKKLMEESA